MADTPVPSEVREVAERLGGPKPMRRGSLTERYMKCGRKDCRCHGDAQARHGPYYSLTRGEGGQTRSRYLGAEEAEVVRQQIATGQQFRKDVEVYWEACERWADAEIEGPEATSQEAVKKGGSKQRSKRRSSPRSKHS